MISYLYAFRYLKRIILWNVEKYIKVFSHWYRRSPKQPKSTRIASAPLNGGEYTLYNQDIHPYPQNHQQEENLEQQQKFDKWARHASSYGKWYYQRQYIWFSWFSINIKWDGIVISLAPFNKTFIQLQYYNFLCIPCLSFTEKQVVLDMLKSVSPHQPPYYESKPPARAKSVAVSERTVSPSKSPRARKINSAPLKPSN